MGRSRKAFSRDRDHQHSLGALYRPTGLTLVTHRLARVTSLRVGGAERHRKSSCCEDHSFFSSIAGIMMVRFLSQYFTPKMTNTRECMSVYAAPKIKSIG
jgi:hypothetical protein